MRDLILLGALLSVFPLILRAPQIGILTWIWVTLMNPQREVYGFLGNFQLNLYIAIITIFAWIASREKKIAPMNPVTALLFLFGFWTCISTYYALQRSFSYDLWERTMKTFVLLFAMVAISNNKARIQAVVWMIVLSLGYVGVKGGGFVIATGGHHHVYGPEGSMITDNNDAGLALVMILPFMNYLRVTTQAYWVRLCMAGAMGLTIIAVIGTYSRGALVALAACAAVYTIRSKSGIIPLVLGALILVALPSLVPSQWFARMSTIQSASQDESFQERLGAWKTSFNVAKARPLVGGGFSAVNLAWVGKRFHSPGSTVGGRASHNMYLQVLSDHGFVGLALYLMLLAAAWYNTSGIIRRTRDRPDLDWANRLARMTQVSLVGYLVGGAGLSMAYYDGFLLIVSLTAALSTVVYRYMLPEGAWAAPRWKMQPDPIQKPRLSIGNARQNSA